MVLTDKALRPLQQMWWLRGWDAASQMQQREMQHEPSSVWHSPSERQLRDDKEMSGEDTHTHMQKTPHTKIQLIKKLAYKQNYFDKKSVSHTY